MAMFAMGGPGGRGMLMGPGTLGGEMGREQMGPGMGPGTRRHRGMGMAPPQGSGEQAAPVPAEREAGQAQ